METVKVICKENKRLGYKIINKEDMQASDKLFTEPKRKPTPKKVSK